MTCKPILSFLGLLLGFLGAGLLWWMGLAPDVDRGGLENLGLGPNEAMERKMKAHATASRFGMALIAAAFLLQLIALVVP